MAESTRRSRVLGLAALLLLVPAAARAYIDPGTGSYLLQVIVAALLGALFTLRLYWRKLVDFLRGLFGRAKKPEAE